MRFMILILLMFSFTEVFAEKAILHYGAGLEVSRGNINGVGALGKFGHDDDMDMGSVEDVWAGTDDYYVNTSGTGVISIFSDSAADTATGTGANTLIIEFLDSDYNKTIETITMATSVTVTTSSSGIRINRMYLASSGTGQTNAGNITASVQGRVNATMKAGDGQTLKAIYTVPNGVTLYLDSWYLTAEKNGDSAVEAQLMTNEDGAGWRVRRKIGAHSKGNTIATEVIFPPIKLLEKTIVKVRVTNVTSNATAVSAGFNGFEFNQ